MSDLTLSEAAARFALAAREPARQTALPEVNRFVRWYGPERAIGELRGHDVSLYADVLGPATPENSRRADCIRAFLTYLKKERLTDTSLAPHLRLRKSSKIPGAATTRLEEPMEMTADGMAALKAELESLMKQRLTVREEIRRAMQDKDFRENAPLDAAKDKQGHQEARIREIESLLKRAVLVDEARDSGRVRVGSTVRVKNLRSGAVVRYSIVGPTEANAADGKISSVSPVGKALLDKTTGDEVEISVPAGTMQLVVEEIEG